MKSGGVAALLLAAALVISSRPASAQEPTYSDLELLSANVLITGIGAGVTAVLRGESFWKASTQGAAAGLVMFAGKRIIAADGTSLGFVGRQVSALGASMSRNAAFSTGVLDTLFIPLGPVRLAWGVRERRLHRAHIDLEAFGWITHSILDDQATFDVGRSLRAGAVVFTTDRITQTHGGLVSGITRGGVVVLSTPVSGFSPRTLHHELIHVAQVDYLKIAFGIPLERHLLRGVGWDTAGVFRYVDLGIGHHAFQTPLRRVLESEADRFEARAR